MVPMQGVALTEAGAEGDSRANDSCKSVKRTITQRRFQIAKINKISWLGYNAGPRRCALSRMLVEQLANEHSIGY